VSAVHLGNFNTATTNTHVRFQFTTHNAAGANVAPSSAFEAADLAIYKADDTGGFSATARSSASGITMTSPFNSKTGLHDVTIDLTDNTDASFYSAGSTYSVVLQPDETVDTQTITAKVLAFFNIGRAQADVREWLGTATTVNVNGVPAVDIVRIEGSAVSTSAAQLGVNTHTITSGAITATAIAADAIGASELAADAVTEIQSGLATAAALATVDGIVDTIVAAVDTEVAAILALLDDARGEPGQGAPGVSVDLATKIDYLYKWARNKKDNDGTETKFYADNGTTVDHKQSTSEAAGTVTVGEMATGA
jgi:hypothetical protein